jgi:cytochrome c5
MRNHLIKPTRPPVLLGGAAALLAAACAAAPTPLPEADSEDARVYVQRCGACHSVPAPGRHTAAEWDRMLVLMDARMAQRAMPPLEDHERDRIRAYLARHARGTK